MNIKLKMSLGIVEETMGSEWFPRILSIPKREGEDRMGSEIWKVYGVTEDEHIEYCRCLEKLENLGFEKIEVGKKLLNCNTCILCGCCTVSRENMFLGAKTC